METAEQSICIKMLSKYRIGTIFWILMVHTYNINHLAQKSCSFSYFFKKSEISYLKAQQLRRFLSIFVVKVYEA